MDWTEIGLWLIGVGSVVVALGIALGVPQASAGGLVFAGPLSSTRARLAVGAETVGVLHVAAGAIITAIVELDYWWLVPSTALTIGGGVYAFVVWKHHQHRVAILGKFHTDESEHGRWRRACLDHCATWRWVLRHPLDDDDFPRDCWNLPGAPPPP